MSKKEQIIEKLKENGCRITKQRKMLIDIILENECSSCKEIFYKASQEDENIGVATVYRMINALESEQSTEKICIKLIVRRIARKREAVLSCWMMIRFLNSQKQDGIRWFAKD